MNKKNILKKLEDDNHYYGKFGKTFLSNSDIGTLLSNPLGLGSEAVSYTHLTLPTIYSV